eukprot:TRINITY_DN18239_c0_g6_i1.p1 TRINITY_DN18239_c0_g6~~TRINITY_DN18239_c0_g6_i1.p1  ORF type:complete len:422 (-),score=36.54 TRINITY_DN18239_c0_g6_i1:258-1463(-)
MDGGSESLKVGYTQAGSLGAEDSLVLNATPICRVSTTADKDVENAIALNNGSIPDKWQDRKESIRAPERYRDGDAMVERAHANDSSQIATANALSKAKEKGLIDSRTVADALVNEGINPFSVQELGAHVLLGFRRKSLAIIIVQSIIVNVIAVIVDTSVALPGFWGICVGLWMVPIALLGVLFRVRYRYPWNWIILFLFTSTVGATFGMLRVPMQLLIEPGTTLKSPQCYFLAAHTLALVIMYFLTCFAHLHKRVMRMLPAAAFAAVCTNVLGVTAYAVHFHFVCPRLFVIIAVIMNTVVLLWVGRQMDKLGSRLQVDEYLLPVILLWSEIFAAIMMIGLCLLAGGDDSTCTCCCCTDASPGFFHCDCCIHYGETSRTARQRPDQIVPGDVAPEVQVMSAP